jgi:flagellar motor switch protein FliG
MKDIDFEELIRKSDDNEVKKSLEKIDREIIARALKITAPETAEKILKNLPAAKAAEIKELVKEMGSIPVKDAETAQNKIKEALASPPNGAS